MEAVAADQFPLTNSAGSQDRLPALRVFTCGSVDDGKSTLIGRLLYERNLIFADQLAELRRDSARRGVTGDDIDYSLLLDGLEAEREQNITIDVAYRYFRTARRSFVVADTPGHEQYTRNMATGASTSDLAIILVDARKGLQTQTLRHAVISSLMGVRHVVLAVNKIDLVGFDRTVFDGIAAEFGRLTTPLGFASVTPIPISARHGDNVAARSSRTPWYRGPSLVDYLERIDIASGRAGSAFRMAVQWVNRAGQDFRGYAGTVASGSVRPGDRLVVARSGHAATVARVISPGGDVPAAMAGDAVTLTLSAEIDIARGDLLVPENDRPQVADQFAAQLIWMSETPLLPGRTYLMKLNHQLLPVSVTNLKYRVDVDSMARLAAATLHLNDIGFCNLAAATPVAFDAYADNRHTGAFILIDRSTHATVAAGMAQFALRRAVNVAIQPLAVTKERRVGLKAHRPAVVWFTGLSGAGKSTIANLVETRLHERKIHTTMLDGDNIRHGINRDLGFTEADRVENIRRIGEIAKLMTEAGLVVLCAFISPFKADRQTVRELVGGDEFIEVFVDTPIEECVRRDPKGLYRKALSGKIKNFTGVGQVYEAPENPEVYLRTEGAGPDQLADDVVRELLARRLI